MEQGFYEQLLENLHDGIYYVDASNKIVYWNKAAERITGYQRGEVMGLSCSDSILRHIDDLGRELCVEGCPLRETLEDGKIRDADIYLHHKDGHRIPVHVRVAPIVDEGGSITGAVEIFSDNSNRINILQEYERLKKEIFIDALTQVGNRKFAEMNIERRFKEFKEYSIGFGVLFIDIDNFKTFNDTFGHNAGDKVLMMVARTISNIMRPLDVVCRWGGEEFVVLIPSTTPYALEDIAERIRVFIMRNWINDDKETLKVTVSIGGTIARRDDTSETVIQRADELMYASKTNGRNMVTMGRE
jgi:diguanylate cyclase (GGDEF)-like protein/PAS domain S-box-containing protein